MLGVLHGPLACVQGCIVAIAICFQVLRSSSEQILDVEWLQLVLRVCLVHLHAVLVLVWLLTHISSSSSIQSRIYSL